MKRVLSLLLLSMLLILPVQPAVAQEIPAPVFYVLGALAGLLEVAVGYKKTLDEIQAMKAWVQRALNETLEKVEATRNETLRKVAEQLQEMQKLLNETEARIYRKLEDTLAKTQQLLLEAERLLNQTKAEARRTLEHVNATLQHYNMLYSSMKEELATLSRELNQTKAMLTEIQERLERLERLSREIGWDRLHAMLEDYNSTLFNALEEFDKAKAHVLEGLQRINTTITALKARIDSLEGEIKELAKSLHKLNTTYDGRLRGLEEALKGKADKTTIDQLQGSLQALRNIVDSLKTSLQRLETDYASKSQLSSLESKITAIEARLNSLQADLTGFKQDFYQYHMIIGIGFVAAVVVAALAYTVARRPRQLLAQVKMLEERLAETEKEWHERMQRLCGLNKDAQVLLEALSKGEVSLVCKDGKPASVIGGKIVCLERQK